METVIKNTNIGIALTRYHMIKVVMENINVQVVLMRLDTKQD